MTKAKAKAPPKTDLWMPLWIGDYLADTMSLSTAQHGAYLLLLMAYWRNRGPLKNDDNDLRGICKADGAEWPALRTKVLERFFTLDVDVTCDVTSHVWRHKRADEELLLALSNKEASVARTAKATAARLEKQGFHPDGSPIAGPLDVARNEARNDPRNVGENGHVTLSPSPSPSPHPPSSGADSVAKATGGLEPAAGGPSAPPAKPPVRDVAAELLPPPGVPVPPAPPPGVQDGPGGVSGAEDDKPELTPEEKRKRAAWRAGKSLLNTQGMAMAQTGTFLGRLARDYGEVVFLEALERAVVQRPADATGWIKATCQTLVGERQATGGKQTQLENGNKAVAARWAAKNKESSNAG